MIKLDLDPEQQQGDEATVSAAHYNATEPIEPKLFNTLHNPSSRAVLQVNMRETRSGEDIQIERAYTRTRRCGYALVIAMCTLLLSKVVSSSLVTGIEIDMVVPLSLVPSIITTDKTAGTFNQRPGDLTQDQEDTLSRIILQRQEEEKRFLRQEKNLKRERLGTNRHAMMKAQEERRREIEEQRKLMEEKRLRVLQRQEEDKLRRDEETVRRKEELAKERKARMDALEARILLFDQSREEQEQQTLQGDESLIHQDQAQEVVGMPRHHRVRRKAKLHTFAY